MKKDKRLFLIPVVIITLFILIIIYISNYRLPNHIEYFAENDFVTIEIHNIKEAKTFEKMKPVDMSVVNDLQEMEKEGSRFILGHVCMDDDYYNEDSNYKLHIERKDGTTFMAPIMMKQWERTNGKVEADFFVTDSETKIYEYLTLLKDGDELVKFKLNQK